MKFTFTKGHHRVEISQTATGDYEVTNFSYLTVRDNWLRQGTWLASMEAGEEIMNRLERKGYAIGRR